VAVAAAAAVVAAVPAMAAEGAAEGVESVSCFGHTRSLGLQSSFNGNSWRNLLHTVSDIHELNRHLPVNMLLKGQAL
jgi:hypothetical protein